MYKDTYYETMLAEIAVSPEAESCYIGSPSLARLQNGKLIASHDVFGKGTMSGDYKELYATTHVFESSDNGYSWSKMCVLQDMHWGSLFVHKGILYILGTDEPHGSIVIRKSEDGGKTFTEAKDSKTGLLYQMSLELQSDGLGYKKYHCAPVPVVNHNGRLYRAFERKTTNTTFPSLFSFIISCAEDADLLNADNWTKSNENTVEDCLEGNIVVGKDGSIYNLLRKHLVNKAFLYRLGSNNRSYSFVKEVNMPGGDVKFTVRIDNKTQKYIALTNIHTDMDCKSNLQRNVLGIIYSEDLVEWGTGNIILQENNAADWNESVKKYGFQYVDWIFDGEDILYLSRTSYDGAHNFHNANRLTLHRLKNFREFLKPLKIVADFRLEENLKDDSPVNNQIRGRAHVAGKISFIDSAEGPAAYFDGESHIDLHYMLGNSIAGSSSLSISFEIKPGLEEMSRGDYGIFDTSTGDKPGIRLFIHKDGEKAFLCGSFRSAKGEEGMETLGCASLSEDVWHKCRFVIDYKNSIVSLAIDGGEVEQEIKGMFNSQRYARSSPAFTDKIGTCEGGNSYRGSLRNFLISREE